jgi:hypothetical protein
MTTDEDAAGAEGVRVAREPDGDELRKAARARALKNLSQVAFVVALMLLLGFSAWNVVLIRGTQVNNRTTLSQAQRAAIAAKVTADRIEDCTTPGGDCFERAQRQTSGAVAGINTITVRATACLAVVLKGIPEGATVVVDDVAAQIQQCIKTTTTAVKPRRVVPTPRLTVTPKQPSGVTGPKGPMPPPAAPSQAPAPPSPSPASPGPTVPSPTTPAGALTDLTCRLVPTLCP